jgi:hypothetical protein
MCLERCLSKYACGVLRETLMAITPLGMAGLLYLMSVTASETLYDLGYVLFHVSFEFMRVMCEAEGARAVAATRVRGSPRFAAISGLSTFGCLGLQSLLQVSFNAFVHESDEVRAIHTQFQVCNG